MRSFRAVAPTLVLSLAACAWPALARPGTALTINQVAGCWAYRDSLLEGPGRNTGIDTLLLMSRRVPPGSVGPQDAYVAVYDQRDVADPMIAHIAHYWMVAGDSVVIVVGDPFTVHEFILRAADPRTLEGTVRLSTDQIGAPESTWQVRAERVHCPSTSGFGAA